MPDQIARSPRSPRWLPRFAAIAEGSLVLLAGNLVAAGILRGLLSPETARLADDLSAESLYPGAAVSALTLTVRFGLMIALGSALLWWRRRETLRDHGLTRAGRSPSNLLVAGLVLYAIAALPMHLLHLLNSLVPIGAGLPIWAELSGKLSRPDFWALMFAGSVVLPPLYEEPFMRGYLRGRLQESYGPLGAVIVSSFLFMLAHGHFYRADALAIASLGVGIFAATCWAYAVLRTGSLIPAMIAHGLGNLPIPHSLANQATLVAISAAILYLARRPLIGHWAAFRHDWAHTDRTATGFGVVVTSLFLVPLLTLRSMGKTALLIPVGLLWVAAFAAAWTTDTVRRHRESQP